MSLGSGPRRIEPDFRTRIWGSPRTEPWFNPADAPEDGKIGEVWFPADDLLIKFLFTSADLSIQVHPDDDYARQHENSRGKTEMWHILRADPGARIALGFKEHGDLERFIQAAETGHVAEPIMESLNWLEVHPGETYLVPAGTVHAIGAGIALCEIQQNSDLTYRLFDYGRRRELHLRQARAVSQPECHPGKAVPRDLGRGVELLVECAYFRTYLAVVDGETVVPPAGVRFVVVIEGSGRVNDLPVSPGSVLAAGSDPWFIERERDGLKLLLIA